MYKGHSSYNTPLNQDDFKDIKEKINEEINAGADKHKLNKLEEAKLMRQLFNNNCFTNTNRHFLPW